MTIEVVQAGFHALIHPQPKQTTATGITLGAAVVNIVHQVEFSLGEDAT